MSNSGNVTIDAGTAGGTTGTVSLGATNASAVTIGHSGVTTTVQGDTLITSPGNTATAFKVQNASNVSLLTLDASNNRLYVGNPTADGTGFVLVLDNKNSSTDPTGVDGAMYYNTTSGAFRCYTDEGWGFCDGLSRASQGFRLYEDFYGEDVTSGSLGSNGWSKTQAGTGASVGKASTDSAAHPGQIFIQTGTATSGNAAVYMSDTGGGPDANWAIGGGEVVEMAVQPQTLSDVTNQYVIRLGLCDNDAGDCTDGIYFEYDSAQSTNWRYATRSNSVSTGSKSNSSVAVTNGSWTRLKIVVNASATSVSFFIDGTLVGTQTTNIPTGTARATSPMLQILKTAGTSGRDFHTDYFEFRNSFATLR